MLAIDAEGDAIVAWSADDEIIVRRWENGRWRSPENVGPGASPTFASGEPVAIAWTRPAGAGYELVVTDLPAPGGTSHVPLFIGTAVLAIIFAALILRRRSRTHPD